MPRTGGFQRPLELRIRSNQSQYIHERLQLPMSNNIREAKVKVEEEEKVLVQCFWCWPELMFL